MSDYIDILCGIDAEQDYSDKPERFNVASNPVRDGTIWKIELEAANQGGRLDESLEGSSAWWTGPGGKGAGDVLAVVPEIDLVLLQYVAGSLPRPGDPFRIYPIPYLAKLRQIWTSQGFAQSRLDWWDHFQARNSKDSTFEVDPKPFPWLRAMQREAFRLPAWRTSFLFGPPGTGKTTTLGAMLAQFLEQSKKGRVLLLSSTNSAVDQALIAVDKSLEELTRGKGPQPAQIRRECLRIGRHFNPVIYEKRTHLLPSGDPDLNQRLIEHQKNRPEKAQAAEYAAWVKRDEALRHEMQAAAFEAMAKARLLAMTTTSATFRLEDLQAIAPFDLVVFDEASQVSIVHALTFTGLAPRILFAGDPHQLAPIVQSDNKDALKWLGESPFSRMPVQSGCAVMLDEQSRMAEPICNLVSHAFYEGKLRVAADKARDPDWLHERRPVHVEGLGAKHAYLVAIEYEPTYSQRMNGHIRPESAATIIQLIQRLLVHRHLEQRDILVITPYRAQRTLIRQRLGQAKLGRVGVQTVHRAQGSERDTIIFDPVKASGAFLESEQVGRRLMNVALSRAKARLFLIASEENRQNQFLGRIVTILENVEATGFVSIQELAKRPDFPRCAVERLVMIPGSAGGQPVRGRVLALEGETKLVFQNFTSGKEVRYDARVWMTAPKKPVAAQQAEDEELARLAAEAARLREENEKLKRTKDRTSLKVSEKGAVSVYGLGRFPVTLYKDQWLRLLDHSTQIREYLRNNSSGLRERE